MVFGMGHGSNFPWLSSSTGRPAIEDSFTVDVTGKACCAAIPLTLTSMAELKRKAIRILANSRARVIPLHCTYHHHRAYPLFRSGIVHPLVFGHVPPLAFEGEAEKIEGTESDVAPNGRSAGKWVIQGSGRGTLVR